MSKEQQIELGRKIEEVYKCKVIIDEEKEPYCLYCASDIGKILKMSNIHSTLTNNYDKFNINCDTNGGKQSMCFITYSGLYRLLTKSRKPHVIDFSNKLNIDISSKIYTCIEADTIKCIIEAFSNEEMIHQYKIAPYIVDLYFPKYKLIIECDETHHKYEIKNDKERENYIKENIDCTFIRYDPYSKDFNIFKVINIIYTSIIS